jgi:hypothetical protein
MNIKAYAFLAGYLDKSANQPARLTGYKTIPSRRKGIVSGRTLPAIDPNKGPSDQEIPEWLKAEEAKIPKAEPGPKRTPEQEREAKEEGMRIFMRDRHGERP